MSAEETYLSFRIFHPDLEPSHVSSEFGLEPSFTHLKGEVRKSKTRRTFAPYPSGLWGLSTRDVVKSTDLLRHFDYILDLLSGKEIVLDKYCGQGCKMDLFVFWAQDGISGGPTIPWHYLQKVASFKLDLNFDVY